MELKEAKNVTAATTYQFQVNGRSKQEVKDMISTGYMELGRCKEAKPRTDGYFCGSCTEFTKQDFSIPDNGSTHDGVCSKFKYRVVDYGCCGGFQPKKGLFAYNP